MKQHILNFVFVAVIAIGGLYLAQPAAAQTSCPDCEKCVVEQGEDPCTTCLGSNCDQESGTKCGTLENVGTGEQEECYRSGSSQPVGARSHK